MAHNNRGSFRGGYGHNNPFSAGGRGRGGGPPPRGNVRGRGGLPTPAPRGNVRGRGSLPTPAPRGNGSRGGRGGSQTPAPRGGMNGRGSLPTPAPRGGMNGRGGLTTPAPRGGMGGVMQQGGQDTPAPLSLCKTCLGRDHDWPQCNSPCNWCPPALGNVLHGGDRCPYGQAAGRYPDLEQPEISESDRRHQLLNTNRRTQDARVETARLNERRRILEHILRQAGHDPQTPLAGLPPHRKADAGAGAGAGARAGAGAVTGAVAGSGAGSGAGAALVSSVSGFGLAGAAGPSPPVFGTVVTGHVQPPVFAAAQAGGSQSTASKSSVLRLMHVPGFDKPFPVNGTHKEKKAWRGQKRCAGRKAGILGPAQQEPPAAEGDEADDDGESGVVLPQTDRMVGVEGESELQAPRGGHESDVETAQTNDVEAAAQIPLPESSLDEWGAEESPLERETRMEVDSEPMAQEAFEKILAES